MELKKTENVSTSDDQLNQHLQKQISSIESKYEALFSRLEQEKRSELEYLKRNFENRQKRFNLQKEFKQKNKSVPKAKA